MNDVSTICHAIDKARANIASNQCACGHCRLAKLHLHGSSVDRKHHGHLVVNTDTTCTVCGHYAIHTITIMGDN